MIKIETEKVEDVIEVRPDEGRFPGWVVYVRYGDQESLRKIAEKATVRKRDRQFGGVNKELDPEKWTDQSIREIIDARGWSGLKLEYLEQMLPLADSTRQAIIRAGGECPFSYEAALVLARKAPDECFAGPIYRYGTVWEDFKAERDRQLRGNSVGSSTTSGPDSIR